MNLFLLWSRSRFVFLFLDEAREMKYEVFIWHQEGKTSWRTPQRSLLKISTLYFLMHCWCNCISFSLLTRGNFISTFFGFPCFFIWSVCNNFFFIHVLKLEWLKRIFINYGGFSHYCVLVLKCSFQVCFELYDGGEDGKIWVAPQTCGVYIESKTKTWGSNLTNCVFE